MSDIENLSLLQMIESRASDDLSYRRRRLSAEMKKFNISRKAHAKAKANLDKVNSKPRFQVILGGLKNVSSWTEGDSPDAA